MTRNTNDTWGLADGVGATATMVAALRALISRDPDAVAYDHLAEPLVRAVGSDFFDRLLDGRMAAESPDFVESMAQSLDAAAVRTRLFDDHLLRAVDTGIRQVVLLASGLDARAYRLDWPDGTVVYDVDQPAVVQFKTITLTGLGVAPRAEHRPVSIDLRAEWPKALISNGFNPHEPTAWLAEGLLIYLPSVAQDRLFDAITSLSAPGSRLATEEIGDLSAITEGGERSGPFRLKKYDVDIDMARLAYLGPRNVVVDYLGALGWTTGAITMHESLQANGTPLAHAPATALHHEMSNVFAALPAIAPHLDA